MQLQSKIHFDYKRRLIYFALATMSFIVVYYTGASIPLSPDEADELASQFAGETADIGVLGLYLNNLQATLLMFVPGFGAGFGAYSGFSTGVLFNALVLSYDLEGISPFTVIATPFGILEVLAYGLAMSRSGMLVYQLVKRKPWRQYVILTAIEVGIVAVLLIVAAVLEGQAIEVKS